MRHEIVLYLLSVVRPHTVLNMPRFLLAEKVRFPVGWLWVCGRFVIIIGRLDDI